MEGFGLRGIPRMIEGIVMDDYLLYAWAVYGLVVVMSCAVFLLGNSRQSVRAARMFWPMFFIGALMTFATPTGTYQ